MMTHIVDIMSVSPVLVEAGSSTSEALESAVRRGVHYVLVQRGENLAGVACRCWLEHARVTAPVSQWMRVPAITIDVGQSIDAALELMEAHRVGCLPVTRKAGATIGVLTRRDLRRHGARSRWLLRTCALCGSSHGLLRANAIETLVCGPCLKGTSARRGASVGALSTVEETAG